MKEDHCGISISTCLFSTLDRAFLIPGHKDAAYLIVSARRARIGAHSANTKESCLFIFIYTTAKDLNK